MPKPLKSPTLEANRKPFTDFLATIDLGDVNKEATDALQDLTHACTETGKAGSMTITVKMKPIGRTGQVELETAVVCKAPAPVKGKTIMFVTPDNNLQREHPKQTTLEGLRTADEEAQNETAVRTIQEHAPAPLRAVGG